MSLAPTIQQRIRERREAFSADVQEVAEWARLSAERWQAIEEGDSLSVAELGQVARALAVDPGTFLRGEERDVRRSVARFRKAADLLPGPRTREIRTLALAAELGRVGGGLYALLNRPLRCPQLRKPIPVSDTEEPWKQGYRLGAAARRNSGIPLGPIVNLQSALEGLGIHIAKLAFSESSVEAASLMENGAMPVILLNQESARIESSLPRRAAMAHELCHLLHDAGEQDLETRLSGNDSSFDDLVEKRARAFAPSFLAPRDEVRLWFDQGGGKHLSAPRSKVLALARRWGLSWQGAVWHAKNCDLISPARAESLQSEAERQEWQDDFERRQPPPGHPTTIAGTAISSLCRGKLSDLVLEALEAGAISRGRALEIVTWS